MDAAHGAARPEVMMSLGKLLATDLTPKRPRGAGWTWAVFFLAYILSGAIFPGTPTTPSSAATLRLTICFGIALSFRAVVYPDLARFVWARRWSFRYFQLSWGTVVFLAAWTILYPLMPNNGGWCALICGAAWVSFDAVKVMVRHSTEAATLQATPASPSPTEERALAGSPEPVVQPGATLPPVPPASVQPATSEAEAVGLFGPRPPRISPAPTAAPSLEPPSLIPEPSVAPSGSSSVPPSYPTRRRSGPLIAAFIVVALCLATTLWWLTRSASRLRGPTSQADRIRRALVLVESFDADGAPIALGSGFLLQGKPEVYTNLHVLKWAKRLTIKTIVDGKRYPVATVAGIDTANDLCALVTSTQIDGASGLTLAAQPSPSVGDAVLVAGNPRGLEGTISRGIVSALRENYGLIQIDAPISSGSSGGPVTNEGGEIIGVTISSIVEGQNLNFAVPARHLKQLHDLNWPLAEAAPLALRDVELEHLKGRPRLMEERTQWPSGSVTLDRRLRFDEAGDILQEEGLIGSSNAFRYWTEYYAPRVAKSWRACYGSGCVSSDPPVAFSWLEGAKHWADRVISSETRFVGDEAGPKKLEAGEIPGDFSRRVYDRLGKLILSEHYPSKVLRSRKDSLYRTVYAYDANGLTTESRGWVDGKWLSSVTRYQYEFDAHGNWIKKVGMDYGADSGALEVNQTLIVELRRFEYY